VYSDLVAEWAMPEYRIASALGLGERGAPPSTTNGWIGLNRPNCTGYFVTLSIPEKLITTDIDCQ